MRARRLAIAGSSAVLLLGGAGWWATAQQTYRMPTPAPDRMPIEGIVTIANVPEVQVVNAPQVLARQEGAWAVHVTDLPPVRPHVPQFLKPGGRYAVTWPGAPRAESYRVLELRPDGWVQVEPVDRPKESGRWINPALAVSIAELAGPPATK